MKLYDVADLAVRNLRESIFRNSLTTIGISVGVASLVAMLSLGIGLQQLASQPTAKVRPIRHCRGHLPARSPQLPRTARGGPHAGRESRAG